MESTCKINSLADSRMDGMGVYGAFAEYILLPFVSKIAVMKLPDSFSFRDLAMIERLGLYVGLAKKVNPDDVIVNFDMRRKMIHSKFGDHFFNVTY